MVMVLRLGVYGVGGFVVRDADGGVVFSDDVIGRRSLDVADARVGLPSDVHHVGLVHGDGLIGGFARDPRSVRGDDAVVRLDGEWELFASDDRAGSLIVRPAVGVACSMVDLDEHGFHELHDDGVLCPWCWYRLGDVSHVDDGVCDGLLVDRLNPFELEVYDREVPVRICDGEEHELMLEV